MRKHTKFVVLVLTILIKFCFQVYLPRTQTEHIGHNLSKNAGFKVISKKQRKNRVFLLMFYTGLYFEPQSRAERRYKNSNKSSRNSS